MSFALLNNDHLHEEKKLSRSQYASNYLSENPCLLLASDLLLLIECKYRQFKRLKQVISCIYAAVGGTKEEICLI